jgi:adenine/guanine phosphoribosyltransferase-like PRPP-binding protein
MIYRGNTLDDLESKVRAASKALKPHLAEFDSIVVQGCSGMLVGAPLALRLKKPLIVVRKRGESRHSCEDVINWPNIGKNCLFVDDFVAGGATRRRCEMAVRRRGGRIVASYLYDTWQIHTNERTGALNFGTVAPGEDIDRADQNGVI